MMKIDQFIQKTLLSIQVGVDGANDSSNDVKFFLKQWNSAGTDSGIHFDIAISVDKESSAEGTVGVIHVISAKLKGRLAKRNKQISRIQFVVHVK
ncbi:MAG: hypothetical protein K8R90_07950 [Candidatus Cloacimonetes bacterium]|nr:hypothetical protein [Candidatus Cloacimonadota bacterium]